ncbi:GerAB/ArcD/ProY family transporter [Paenibacillus ferrarius]|uniref:GerAB/ArcD/ProY family transporter n=1 Tax=Paenibacillus ferrarius TaxID=1469647 RepID=UPI003D2C8476
MDRTSNYQLAVMMILFEIGSTPIFALGSSAKQDAWLAMLAAAIVGFILLNMFLFIQNKAPNEDLIGLLRLCFGKWAGTGIGILFALYFAYESMRNVRDFGEIANLTLLKVTPKSVTMSVIVLLAIYAISMGIRTLFHITEALLPIVMISYMLLTFLIFLAKLVQPGNLLPVLEHGIAPVLKAAFPDIISFPFGQTVIFFMLWHLIPDKQKMKRFSLISYTIVALFLVSMNMLNIMVLGVTINSLSILPFLQAVQLIEVGNILERLDVMVTLLLFLGLFVKMMTFCCGSVYAFAHLFPRIPRGVWLILVSTVIYATSFTEPNYTVHAWIGLVVVVKKVFPIFQIVIPVIMFFILLFRKLPAGQHALPSGPQPGGSQ